MHLLTQIDTKGFDAWKSDFDDAAEIRMQAGLTLLQMWRGADLPHQVTCLFEVNDRDKAQDWLARETGFGQAVTAHFLRTV